MGSEFTNADMVKPNMDDFNYKLLPDATLSGKECWIVETICKDEDIEDANGFSRQVFWIEKGTYLCHKIEYYDLDNELHRIQTIKDYRKQSDGGYFAFFLKKENIQNGRKSTMKIDEFLENSTMPESAFSPTALGK
jgi:outer membrane lipoprotein-sorting protein